jgi:hypothetical protein
LTIAYFLLPIGGGEGAGAALRAARYIGWIGLEKGKLLWVLAMAIAGVGIVLIFVPMVFGVGYMSVMEALLWECFNRITVLIPIFALAIALVPLKLKSRWAWRIPLAAGIFVMLCCVGMIFEDWWFSKNINSLGFHPIGMVVMNLMGWLFLIDASTSRRVMRRRISILEGKCLKCGYDLRATPERCPKCGCVPPTAVVSASGL